MMVMIEYACDCKRACDAVLADCAAGCGRRILIADCARFSDCAICATWAAVTHADCAICATAAAR